VDEQVGAAYVLAPTNAFAPFRPGAEDALAGAPGTEVVPVRGARAEIGGTRATVTGVDLSAIAGLYRFDWATGSEAALRELGPDAALVERDFAKKHGLGPGDRTTVVSEFGERVTVEVAALYDAPPFWQMLGQVTIPIATFDRTFADPRCNFAALQPF